MSNVTKNIKKSDPIDIPNNENVKENKYSLSYWLRSSDKKVLEPVVNQMTVCPPEDKGIFSMSSTSEQDDDNEESNSEYVSDSDFNDYQDEPRQKTCCRVLSNQFKKFTGFNSEPMVTIYEVAYDKADKDFDKIWEKCTVENFNAYTDSVLKNFAKNFHWVVFGFWFHSIQNPKKIMVPVYVNDCGHLTGEI